MTSKAGGKQLAPGWDPVARPFPPARRGDDSQVYKSAKHGEVKVEQPYLWLETPPSESKETDEWVNSQAAYTEAYAKGCDDRAEMKKRLEGNLDYAKYSTPSRTGRLPGQEGDYYYSYNSGLDPQACYYKTTYAELLKAEQSKYSSPPGEKWFDQNLLSKDGTVAISSMGFSKSGKYVVYGINDKGSDWATLYFRETSKPFVTPAPDEESASKGGPDRMDDVVEHLKYCGPTWTHDDKGVFYLRFPAPQPKKGDGKEKIDHGTSTAASVDAQLYYHRLGTSQKEDVLVISKDEKIVTSMFYPSVSV